MLMCPKFIAHSAVLELLIAYDKVVKDTEADKTALENLERGATEKLKKLETQKRKKKQIR